MLRDTKLRIYKRKPKLEFPIFNWLLIITLNFHVDNYVQFVRKFTKL